MHKQNLEFSALDCSKTLHILQQYMHVAVQIIYPHITTFFFPTQTLNEIEKSKSIHWQTKVYIERERGREKKIILKYSNQVN